MSCRVGEKKTHTGIKNARTDLHQTRPLLLMWSSEHIAGPCFVSVSRSRPRVDMSSRLVSVERRMKRKENVALNDEKTLKRMKKLCIHAAHGLLCSVAREKRALFAICTARPPSADRNVAFRRAASPVLTCSLCLKSGATARLRPVPPPLHKNTKSMLKVFILDHKEN